MHAGVPLLRIPPKHAVQHMFSVLTIYLSPGPRSYSYVCGHERLPWIGLRRFCLSARDDGISIGMKNVDKSLNVFDSNSLRAD